MEVLLNRYRNVAVLLGVIVAQLLLLAYQVRSQSDMRLIRLWAVTAVTPFARLVEGVRSSVAGVAGNYFFLRDLREENRKLQTDLGRLKLENQFLKTELSTADRARALSAFQTRTPSRTIAARVIGAGAGANSKVVYVDRGSVAGVMKGMAVVTPDGIVGKVIAAFPIASEVLLVTDPTFAAGVTSQKNRVRGILKGSYGNCKVDAVQPEEKVEVGEWFFTSGDDRVFPKGLLVGQVRVVRQSAPFQEILIEPSGTQNGLEEVLIVLEAVHQQIPDQADPAAPVYLTPPLPVDPNAPAIPVVTGAGTEADRLRDRYKALGDAQGHTFGAGGPGSRPPDFTTVGGGPSIPLRPATAKPAPTQPGNSPPARPQPRRDTPDGTSPDEQQTRPPARRAIPETKPAGPETKPAGPPPAP